MTINDWLDQAYPDAKDSKAPYFVRDSRMRELEEKMWNALNAHPDTPIFDDGQVHQTGLSIIFDTDDECFQVFNAGRPAAHFRVSARGNSFMARASVGDWNESISS
jgi:hypothetical protein